MTKRQKRALLARRLRNKADRYRTSMYKLFTDDNDGGLGWRKMIDQDHKDLRLAARLLREGKEMKAAKIVVRDLDTAVRDTVPSTVYDYLEKVYWGD